MKPSDSDAQAFQARCRAHALMAQLPEDDIEAARAAVRAFLRFAAEAGLLPLPASSPASALVEDDTDFAEKVANWRLRPPSL